MSAVPGTASCLREVFDVTAEMQNGSYKKSWCLLCQEACVKTVLAADAELVRLGQRDKVRSLEEAKTHSLLFTPKMPISSNPDVLARHVAKCMHLDDDTRKRLLHARAQEKLAESQRRGRVALRNITNSSTATGFPVGGPSASFVPPYPFNPALPQLPHFPNAPPPEPSTSMPTQFMQAMGGSTSAPLRRSVSDGLISSAERQHEFAADLTRWFATCNIAWNVAAHAETRTFFSKWIPHVTLPCRDSMSGPLLKAEAALAISHTRHEVAGRLAMAQWDGWKNVARKSVITCMMTVQNKAHLVRSHDTFGKPKTGDFLWELAQSDINYMASTFGVELIGICTDDGPDGKRMRRLARQARPHLIVLVCWAHQNQLIVGDLIKSDPELKALLNRALDVSKWFLSHSAALAHLHEEQTQYLGCSIALTLLLPVITRWGAHYCSTARLLRLKQAVQMACLRHAADWRAIRSRSDSEENAPRAPRTEAVIQTIKDDGFWAELLSAKEHLEPLAIASHILQSDHTRPDHVVFTLGNYVRIYKQPHVKPSIREAVLTNVEKRWQKADQEVFIVAVILNPYVRTSCFSNALPQNVAVEACMRMYERVYRQPTTLEFWEVCNRYLQRTHQYSDASFSLEFHNKIAERDGDEPNLVSIWEARRLPDASTPAEQAHNALVSLAIRMLSVVANSGACERGFSGFGVTQTKRRSRLAVQSTHNINVVRMFVEDQHIAHGRIRPRKKRALGSEPAVGAAQVASNPASTDAAPAPQNNDDLELEAADMLSREDSTSDPTDLDTLLDALGSGAADDDDEQPDTHPISIFPSSIPSHLPKITLSALFKYSMPENGGPHPLERYWKGGIRDLAAEEALLEAANQ